MMPTPKEVIDGLMYDGAKVLAALEHAGFTVVTRPRLPESKPARRDDWHYDSQGYCDNPGRGY